MIERVAFSFIIYLILFTSFNSYDVIYKNKFYLIGKPMYVAPYLTTLEELCCLFSFSFTLSPSHSKIGKGTWVAHNITYTICHKKIKLKFENHTDTSSWTIPKW